MCFRREAPEASSSLDTHNGGELTEDAYLPYDVTVHKERKSIVPKAWWSVNLVLSLREEG